MSEILAGRNVVREALLANRRKFVRVIMADNIREQGAVGEILALCREKNIAVARAGHAEIDHLSGEMTHQGVIAEVSAYPYVDLDTILRRAEAAREPVFLLVLDSLQDPQNVGALMRTAEAVGVHGVVIPTRRAAQITPAVSRASAGAVEHLQISRVTNIARTLKAFREENIWVAGIEDHPNAQDYRLVDLNMPLALVLGSEGEGMRRLVAETCDFLLRIPMKGRINSLNVSVAGAVALYWALDSREPVR